LRCFQQNFITPFIYSKIGSTSSGAALAAAVPWIAPLVVLLSVHSSLAAPFPISHKGGFDRQPLPSTGCRWLTVHTSKMLVLSAFHRQPILSTDRQPL